MKDVVFKQIMRLIHSERPLTEEQRDILQGVLDSDERQEIFFDSAEYRIAPPEVQKIFRDAISSLDQNICADCSVPIPDSKFTCVRCGDE